MVKILLKGIEKRNGSRVTFSICEFKACVVLLDGGGIQVTVTDQELSGRFREAVQ